MFHKLAESKDGATCEESQIETLTMQKTDKNVTNDISKTMN